MEKKREQSERGVSWEVPQQSRPIANIHGEKVPLQRRAPAKIITVKK